MPTEPIATWCASSQPTTSSRSTPWTPAQGWAELPFEIRERIWSYTLQPRLIFLFPHARIALPFYGRVPDQQPGAQAVYSRILNRSYDVFSPIVSLRFNHAIYNPKYTLAEHFLHYATFADTEKIGREALEMERARLRAVRPLKYRNSKPPPALYVCRQSRQLALRQGYVLAFKGVDKGLTGEDKVFWKHNNLSQKGIWVDFANDLIIFDAMYRTGIPFKCAPLQSLKLLTIFAPEEVRIMKKIALGSSFPGGLSGPNAQAQVRLALNGGWRFTWNRDWKLLAGMGFQSLEEMWVTSSEPVYYKGTRSFRLIGSGKQIWQPRKVIFKEIMEEIQDSWISILRKPAEGEVGEDEDDELAASLPDFTYGLNMVTRAWEEWNSELPYADLVS